MSSSSPCVVLLVSILMSFYPTLLICSFVGFVCVWLHILKCTMYTHIQNHKYPCIYMNTIKLYTQIYTHKDMHNYIYIHADKGENACIYSHNMYIQKHNSENKHTIIHMHKYRYLHWHTCKMKSCTYHHHHLCPSTA